MADVKQKINTGQHQNLTRADCRKMEVSGIRYDNLMKCYEIWVLGNLVREVTAQELLLNPMAHVLAFAEVFCMDPNTLIFEDPTATRH